MAEQLLKILMVEDNPADIDLFWVMLDEISTPRIELTKCEMLREAEQLLDQNGFDVVLLDLNLPDSRGLDTFRRLYGQFSQYPIVVLSSLDDEEIAIEALREGAQDYLVKWSLNVHLIIRAIRYAMERKKTEIALRNSEERFRVLFHESPDAMYLHDLKGRVLEANPAAYQLLGITPDETLNRTVFELNLLAEEQLPQAVEDLARLVRGESTGAREYDLIRRNGSRVPVEIRAHPVVVAAQKLVFGVARNVTFQKMAEEALRDSEKRFRTAFENAAIGMCLNDTDGRFIKVNKAFCELVGYSEDQLIFMTYISITHPDDLDISRECVRSLLEHKCDKFHFEKRYIHKNGHHIWAQVTTFLLRDDNNQPLYFIVHIQDVTSRKQAENALRSAYDDLERKVAERTAELAASNKILQTEIEERLQAVEALNTANRALKVLSACNKAVVRAENETWLIEEVCRIVVEVGGYKNAWVAYATHEQNRSFHLLCQKGVKLEILERGRLTWVDGGKGLGPTRLALRSERHVFSRNKTDQAEFDRWREEAIGNELVVALTIPLRSSRQRFGVLAIGSGNEEAFSQEETRLLVNVADDLAHGIMTIRAYEERQRVERQLRISNFALSSSLNAIGITDLKGMVTYVNNSFLQMWGFENETEVLGRPIRDFWENKEVITQIQHGIIESGGWIGELAAIKKDGTKFEALITSNLVKGRDGMPICLMSSMLDITEMKKSEKALSESEERYRSAMEAAANPFAVFDIEGRASYVNPAFTSVFGWSSEEVVGRQVDFVPRERIQETNEAIDKLLHDLSHVTFESQRHNKNGKILDVSISASPYRDNHGQVQGFVVNLQDISERKQIERANAWEAEVNAFMSGLAQSILTMDDIDEISSLLLSEARRMTKSRIGFVGHIDPNTGYLIASTLAREAWDASPVGDNGIIFKEFKGLWGWVLNNKQSLLTNTPNQDSRSTGTPPGHMAIHRFISSPALLGDKLMGQVALANADRDYDERDLQLLETLAGLFSLAVQRKRSQEAIEASESKFRRLVETMPDGLFITDENGAITYTNERFCHMLDFTEKELVGMSTLALLNDPRRQLFPPTPPKTNPERMNSFELSFTKNDGRSIATLVSSKGLINEAGSFAGSMYIVTDITQRKLMERQLFQAQKLESIGGLAAGIAHEINTPLQYVGNNSKFLHDAYEDVLDMIGEYHDLLRSSGNSDLHARSEEIARNHDFEYLKTEIPLAMEQSLEGIERVSAIVQSMKGFAHPGQDTKTLLDINKAIENTIIISRNEWKYVADIATDLDSSLPPVPCLAGEFNQVILNLIINAGHAIAEVVGSGGKGRGLITIGTQKDNDWVEIRIADTGSGISEDIASRVFDPFFTTKEVGKGTGQGLAIAYSVIVEKHQGRIFFETEPGRGTTFVVRLPLNPRRIEQ